ncbi:hypothetical protein GN956_G9692 [Arapaima gigas]
MTVPWNAGSGRLRGGSEWTENTKTHKKPRFCGGVTTRVPHLSVRRRVLTCGHRRSNQQVCTLQEGGGQQVTSPLW